MSLQDIRNFQQINDRILTGGQPTAEQIRAVAAEGIQAIINLAPTDSRSLPGEAGFVRELGMDYQHIPVAWTNPTENDFESFARAMKEREGKKLFIHCAANYRVTAFFSLYALRELNWSEQQADELMARVWKRGEYPVWDEFVEKIKKKISSAR